MNDMQQFYDTEIVADPASPYAQLAQTTPEDILLGDLLEWVQW